LVHKITMKAKGESTLGGIDLWFDQSTFRLKNVESDIYLGEFFDDDKIIVVNKNGVYRLTTFDLTNHYDTDTIYIGKFDPEKPFNAIYFNGEQNYIYLKRFPFEDVTTAQKFIPDDEKSYLIELTEFENPFIEIIFGGKDKNKEAKIISADEFIAVKSTAAKGKRLTEDEVDSVKFIIPEIDDDDDEIDNNDDDDNDDGDDDNITPNNKIEFEVTLRDGKQINLDL